MVSDKRLSRILSYDPIAEAKTISGEDNFGLGLILANINGNIREKVLLNRDDTIFTNSVDRYRDIITRLGFEPVLVDAFEAYNTEEQYFIFAHRDGMLLTWDTISCRDRQVNSATLYYNWKPHDGTSRHHDVLRSGGWREHDQELIWVGDHDAREALVMNVTNLRNRGDFLPQWKAPAARYLLHYEEWKSALYDHDTVAHITQERIDRLPDWVREMINT